MKKYTATENAHRIEGTYTYRSELNQLQRAAHLSGQTSQQEKTEYYGYFHPSNTHDGSDDRDKYEQVMIKHSLFQRGLLHAKQVNGLFNPWSVLERFPAPSTQAHHLFLIYACGENFALVGANVQIYVAHYEASEIRRDVEGRFVQCYDAPLVIDGEAARGYQKRQVAVFQMPERSNAQQDLVAIKVTISGNPDNATGTMPAMHDLFLEGFSVHAETEKPSVHY